MADKLIKSAKYFVASIKDADTKLGIVTGYASEFNSLDSDRDIVMTGAFTKTIKEQGPDSTQPRIKHLLNHNTEQPLGKLLVLKEDAKGLYYESKVGSNAIAVDYLKMVDSGLITEHSIGYSVIKKTIINPDANWMEQQTQLNELKLWELSSLTAWGANQNTPLLGLKNLTDVNDRITRLIKAINTGTFTDSTFAFLNDELLYLQKALKEATTKPEDTSTLPGDMKGVLDTIKLLTLNIKK